MIIDKNQSNTKEKALQKTNLKQGFSKRRRWYHQESNRGHTDFQSVALPTELWHLFFVCNEWCFSIASAKVQLFFETAKFFCDFLFKNRDFSLKYFKNAAFSYVFALVLLICRLLSWAAMFGASGGDVTVKASNGFCNLEIKEVY